MNRILAFLVAGILFVACATRHQAGESVSSTPATGEVRVCLGETAEVGEDLDVTFVDVLEDSRCPEDATCVWAGRARILIELVNVEDPDNPSTPFRGEVSTQGDTFTAEGLRVGLVALEPVPRTKRPVDEPPCATLAYTPSEKPSSGSVTS